MNRSRARDTSWPSRPHVMNGISSLHLVDVGGRIRTAERLQRPRRPREEKTQGMSITPDNSAPGMLLASIGFRIQPHKRAEVLSAVDETVRRMRQASGCARSRLMEDTDDPNTFTVLSEWQSADTADSFFSSRDFQIFKGIRILLRDEPVIVLDDVRSRVTRSAARTVGRTAAGRLPASTSGCATCSASSRGSAPRPRRPRSASGRRRGSARCGAARRRSASRCADVTGVSSAGCHASLSENVEPRDTMSARCTTFSSSRTLPGQSCVAQRLHHVVGNRCRSSDAACDPAARRGATRAAECRCGAGEGSAG